MSVQLLIDEPRLAHVNQNPQSARKLVLLELAKHSLELLQYELLVRGLRHGSPISAGIFNNRSSGRPNAERSTRGSWESSRILRGAIRLNRGPRARGSKNMQNRSEEHTS